MLIISFANFLRIKFSKKSLSRTLSVSIGLDPDQDRQSVGPDSGPNCLQRSPTDNTIDRVTNMTVFVSHGNSVSSDLFNSEDRFYLQNR